MLNPAPGLLEIARR